METQRQDPSPEWMLTQLRVLLRACANGLGGMGSNDGASAFIRPDLPVAWVAEIERVVLHGEPAATQTDERNRS